MLSGSWPGEIYWFRRKPNGTYAAGEVLKDRSSQKINVGSASAIAFADWDDDNDLDLFIGNIQGAVFFVPNEGTASKPSFGKPEPVKAGNTAIRADGGDAGPTIADWDRDGKLDLLVGTGSGAVFFYRNVGDKSERKFAAAAELLPANEKQTAKSKPTRSASRAKLAVADWNGDGLDDLLVGDFVGGENREYHGWVWVYLRKPLNTAAK